MYLVANNTAWKQSAVSRGIIGPIARPTIVHVSWDVVRQRLCSKSEKHELVGGASTEKRIGWLEQVSFSIWDGL